MNPRLLISIVFLFVSTVFPFVVNAQKKSVLSEEELKTWWQKDIIEDTIPGISLDRAYRELIQNKKGEEVIVAVLDTKIDISHEDIKGQLWINIDEIPNNNIDDDYNGYIDDINGWNFLGNNNGEDILYELVEVARIVQKYQNDFTDMPEEDLTIAQNELFDTYQKALSIYNDQKHKALEQKERADKAYVDFISAKDFMKPYFKGEKMKIKSLDSLKKVEPKLADYVDFFKELIEYDITEKDYDYSRDYYNNELLMYNIDDDERKILRDGNSNFENNNYGNNILDGEVPFEHSIGVSGILAATRNNQIGIDGFSNNITLMPVIMVCSGDEHDKDVSKAIYYAVDNGADIINMSWGKDFSLYEELVRDALRYAADKNVLLVTGSGNDGRNIDIGQRRFPTDFYNDEEFISNFISVGASSHKMDSTFVTSFSNYGKVNVDVFAPGENIYTTKSRNTYKTSRGTSYSSPIVSGIAALLKSYYPKLTAVELKKIIMDSGTSIDINVIVKKADGSKELVPFTELSKTGKIVNAYNALKMAEEVTRKSK